MLVAASVSCSLHLPYCCAQVELSTRLRRTIDKELPEFNLKLAAVMSVVRQVQGRMDRSQVVRTPANS